MNAEVEAEVYCRPTVCVAYPPKRITPAVSPARTSIRRSGPRRRSAGTAAGINNNVAIPNRPSR